MAKKKTARDSDISTKPSIRKKLLELYTDVEKGFVDQRGRSDDIMDYWDAYNCKLGERQFYSGNSEIFVPIIKNAIKARKTRFVNQIFPQSGRYVEVTTVDEDIPHATMALAEHYIRKCKLRTQLVPSLLTNGDVEGQYSVYAGWGKTTRHVVSRETKAVEMGGLEFPDEGEYDDIVEEEIEDEGPQIEVLADADLLIVPQTVDSIEEALEIGGSVTVLRRWTKAKIKKLVKDGMIVEEAADALLEGMSKKDTSSRVDTRKTLAEAAGIKSGATGKYILVFETWAKLKVDGDQRLCVAWFGGQDIVLGARLNPYWCDLCPVISSPVDKLGGVFKGRAPVADVIDMQIDANDAINEAADTAHFAAMPIVMTDPEKNPRVGSMVLGLAAVWETSPKDTQFAQFPPLWKDGLERVVAAKNEIFQTLGVNPAMIAQSTGGKGGKRNQAEIATEQQVDLLTTADAVTGVEEGILSPLVQRIILYDHQFRKKPILIKKFGEMGLRATMEEVKPIQELDRYEFRWFGVEAARNAAQIQQQIGFINVLKGIPPQMYPGYRLRLSPILSQMVENVFGPRMAPLLFEDLKRQIGISAEMENQMLLNGFDVQVHTFDNDQEHLQAHMPLMAQGDPTGAIRAHIMRHQQQMQMKAQAAGGGGMPGSPGGAGQPGSAGTPRPGAQPAGPRLLKQPEGAISPERMVRAGAVTMPRKF